MLNSVYLCRTCDKGGRHGCQIGAAQLIRQLQCGDLEALGKLFEQHKDMVYRTAFAMTRDAHVAEDILQECFVRLWTYCDSVDSHRSLKPWLYRVTVNLVYDWSSKKRIGQSLDDVLEWLSGLPGGFPSPDHQAEARENSHMVQDVVAGLPAAHKAVVVLFYMENLAVDEIVSVLELPVGTVKSRLHYARKRLRKVLSHRQRPVPEMVYEFT